MLSPPRLLCPWLYGKYSTFLKNAISTLFCAIFSQKSSTHIILRIVLWYETLNQCLALVRVVIHISSTKDHMQKYSFFFLFSSLLRVKSTILPVQHLRNRFSHFSHNYYSSSYYYRYFTLWLTYSFLIYSLYKFYHLNDIFNKTLKFKQRYYVTI